MRLKKAESGKPVAVKSVTEQTEPVPEKSNPRGASLVVALSTPQSDPVGAGRFDPRVLDRQIQAAIGAQLRLLYNDVATAPVPEHLSRLLDELEAKANRS